jgi:ketosteroid isomerase-like protein
MTVDTAIANILEADKARCEATGDRDYDRLESLLTDDLVHIHMTGTTQNKEVYMAGVRALTEASKRERGDLNVRVYGDTAVMTGVQYNVASNGNRTEMMVTQVWRLTGDGWKQSSFHACRITPRTS